MMLPPNVTKEMLAQTLLNGIEDGLFTPLWMQGVRRCKAPKQIYDWIMVRWLARTHGVPPHSGDVPALAWRTALRMWNVLLAMMKKANP